LETQVVETLRKGISKLKEWFNLDLNHYQIKEVAFQPAQYSDCTKYKAEKQPGVSQLFQKTSADISVPS